MTGRPRRGLREDRPAPRTDVPPEYGRALGPGRTAICWYKAFGRGMWTAANSSPRL